MKWFGPAWGAHINETNEEVEAPLDRPCAVCSEPIEEGQRGLLFPFSGGPEDPPDLPYHLRCFLKSVAIDTLCGHPKKHVRRRSVGRRVYSQCGLCGAEV